MKLFENAVNKARKSPRWFLENVLNNTGFDPWQLDLIEAVFDVDRKKKGLPTVINHEGKNRFTIRSCHGTGKTTAIALLMHAFQFTRRAKIIVTAPKEKTVTTRVWPAFRGISAGAVKGYTDLIRAQNTSITWANNPDWCALVETATAAENLAGHHPSVDIPELMFLVEEASGVSDNMFPAIEGALSTEGAILVMISNPTKTEGEFYRSHMVAGTKELYYKVHIPPEASSFVSPQWVTDMECKYGKNSPIVKIRCRGEFSDLTPNQLIPMELIEAAIGPVPPPDGSMPKLRVSVDVADGGEDECVVTAAKHYDSCVVALEQKRYSFNTAESPIRCAEEAINMFNKYKGNKTQDDIVVDSLGVGAGTAGYLLKKGYQVIIYKGGSASDDSTEWRNRRVQSSICLRDAFQRRSIVLSETMFDNPQDWEDLRGQLTSIQRKPGTERLEDLVTKEEMKRMNIKSPDMAESLIMQMATQHPTLVDDWDDDSVGSLTGSVVSGMSSQYGDYYAA